MDTTAATDPVGPDPETASWVDEFDDDGLNLGVWGYESPFFGSGDGSAHLYDPGAIEVRDGLLVITASRLETPLSVDDDNDGTADRDLTWQSGFLTTRDRYSFTYGRIDVRARVPAGQGLWPAIWLRPADRTYGSWPKSGEIDIVEILGHEPDRAHTTAHWSNEGHTLDAVPYDMTPTEDGFHIFSLEWSPERLTWFIDGQLVHELIGWPSEVGAAPAPFDQDFYLNVNMAVGGNWPGAPDDSTPEGARFEVDWIRVHELDEAGT